jgi:hypothetical protein
LGVKQREVKAEVFSLAELIEHGINLKKKGEKAVLHFRPARTKEPS